MLVILEGIVTAHIAGTWRNCCCACTMALWHQTKLTQVATGTNPLESSLCCTVWGGLCTGLRQAVETDLEYNSIIGIWSPVVNAR